MKTNSKLYLLTILLTMFLANCSAPFEPSSQKSLTSQDFKGKKYFVSWAANRHFDTPLKQAETKFDVSHMDHIFSREWGGKYTKNIIIKPNMATKDRIMGMLKRAAEVLTEEDMYLQYSASHGTVTGLEPASGFGSDEIQYGEIRDQILRMKAKEVVVFMMACHSGAFIESFKELDQELLKEKWHGRNLFIMTSSTADEESYTGPGLDVNNEPIRYKGSAGSLFGYHLWRALSGEADKGSYGNNNGEITLAEISTYIKNKVGPSHTPVIYGFYNPNLVLAKNVGPIELKKMHKNAFETGLTKIQHTQKLLAKNSDRISEIFIEKHQLRDAYETEIMNSQIGPQLTKLHEAENELISKGKILRSQYFRLQRQLGCRLELLKKGHTKSALATILGKIVSTYGCSEEAKAKLRAKLSEYEIIYQNLEILLQKEADLINTYANDLLQDFAQKNNQLQQELALLREKNRLLSEKEEQYHQLLYKTVLKILEDRVIVPNPPKETDA